MIPWALDPLSAVPEFHSPYRGPPIPLRRMASRNLLDASRGRSTRPQAGERKARTEKQSDKWKLLAHPSADR